jgi:hypothetical protein
MRIQPDKDFTSPSETSNHGGKLQIYMQEAGKNSFMCYWMGGSGGIAL